MMPAKLVRAIAGVAVLLATASFVAAQDKRLPAPADTVHVAPRTGERVDRFVDVGGLQLHYLDFGGEGLPILFIHSGSRGAGTWRDFAPRFTDHHRVLAITARGVGDSEGEPGDAVTRAGDILALLDALGIERAVLIGNSSPAQEMTYLAENLPERLAGLVYLAHAPTAAASLSDPSGAMPMYWRHIAAQMGVRPDSDIFFFRPRYLDDNEFRIDVPALTFINQEGTRGLERVPITLLIAEGVRQQGSAFITDSAARAFFERLATDVDLRARVRAAWNEVIRPAELANQKAFERAFGEHLQIVALDVPLRDGVPVVTGYEYRDAPELIEPHIRRFLADLGGR